MGSSLDIPGFKNVSDSSSYYQSPSAVVASEKPKDGVSLLVVCPWTAALPKHITRYAGTYRQKFPDASILIIQTSTYDALVRWSDSSHDRRLKPARDIILEHQQNAPSEYRVLQAFSNGGALTTRLLLSMIRPSFSGKLFSAMVFDSCPSRGDYWGATKAVVVSTSLPKLHPVLYALGSAIVHVALLGLAARNVLGIESRVDQTHRGLNDKNLVDDETARLYIYSKADQIINWVDVQDHAAEATKQGHSVDELLFEDTEHCRHFFVNPEKYLDAIMNTLKKKELIKSRL